MKCYNCGIKYINIAVRAYVKLKRKPNEKGFRDLCTDCYDHHMKEQGYKLIDGIWKKQ